VPDLHTVMLVFRDAVRLQQ